MSTNASSKATEVREAKVVAAVDLGSNSFHMVLAQNDFGKLRILDKMRDRVRLAEGLQPDGGLDKDARKRAVACLERFGERLQDISATQVRVVGTNTLRIVKNASDFLAELRSAIGHPIDIISGREEARLIYLGVAHDVVESGGKRLVVDIGGGSTECIIGERLDPIAADSLHMGCVTFSKRFFPNGKMRADALKDAELAAAMELRSIKRSYRDLGWEHAIGASGTVTAIHQILRTNGFADGITWPGLDWLRKTVLASGRTSRLELAGLEEDRRDVLPGGLAILISVFRSLKIDRMDASTGALREGVLYDLLGRSNEKDIRERTVQSMAKRYDADPAQIDRVLKTALRLLEQLAGVWQLDFDRSARFLTWAAHLHEIGLAVTYSGYHKHGEYLIEHSDMPGFSRGEQRILARLVRVHRRRFKPEVFEDLSVLNGQATSVHRLAIILRLAVALNRSRSDEELPDLKIWADDATLSLEFPAGWLELHPMTRLELERETQRFLAFEIQFSVK